MICQGRYMDWICLYCNCGAEFWWWKWGSERLNRSLLCHLFKHVTFWSMKVFAIATCWERNWRCLTTKPSCIYLTFSISSVCGFTIIMLVGNTWEPNWKEASFTWFTASAQKFKVNPILGRAAVLGLGKTEKHGSKNMWKKLLASLQLGHQESGRA